MFPFLERFNKDGALIAKPGRKAIPVGHKRPETLAEQVARLVRNSEFARVVAAQGLETFEEADDFDVDDEIPLPNTPWEQNFDFATVHASERGVVKMPTPQEVARSKSALDKARNALRKRKLRGSGTPPAGDSEESSGAPHVSEEDSSET